jgi:hypothetical protein
MDVTGAGVPAAPPLQVATAPAAGLRARAAVLAATVAATGYVGLLDPDRHGAYPVCPSRVLLRIDCPGCGGLRGTHALLRGRVAEALDHNLLLPAVLGVMGVSLALWLLPLVGRPARRLTVPRWATVTALVVVVAYTVARNLPVAGLDVLGSGAA